ncbi:MAG: hypothetical protein ACK5JH_13480 [Anaerocolumna sp.]
MSEGNEKDLLNQYKDIHSLSQKEKSSITLIINPEKNQIAVKKCITGSSIDIYNKLKETTNIHFPKIYLLMEEKDNIITA